MRMLASTEELKEILNSKEYQEFKDTVVARTDVDAFLDFINKDGGTRPVLNVTQTHVIKYHAVTGLNDKIFLENDTVSSSWFFNKLLKNFPLPVYLTEKLVNPSLMMLNAKLHPDHFETLFDVIDNDTLVMSTLTIKWIVSSSEFILIDLLVDGERRSLDDYSLSVPNGVKFNLKTGTVTLKNSSDRLEIDLETPRDVDKLFRSKDYRRFLKTFPAETRDSNQVKLKYIVERCKFKHRLPPVVKHAIRFVTGSLPDLEVSANKEKLARIIKKRLFPNIPFSKKLVLENPNIQYRKWLNYPAIFSDNFAPIRLTTLQLKIKNKQVLELEYSQDGNTINILEDNEVIYILKGFAEQPRPYIDALIEFNLIDEVSRDGYYCKFEGCSSDAPQRTSVYEMTYCLYGGELEILSLTENTRPVDMKTLHGLGAHLSVPLVLTAGPVNIVTDYPQLSKLTIPLCVNITIELS